MKLAILKFIVYFMGVLLIGSVLFLGYAIYKKTKDPDWSPIRLKQESKVVTSTTIADKQPWPPHCLSEDKELKVINTNRIAILSRKCDFVDIYDSHGQFINRIELRVE